MKFYLVYDNKLYWTKLKGKMGIARITLCLLSSILKYQCPDEEKGCSARDLVKVGSCRAEHLLSKDIKYVIIG